jgi:hypothetical protein
VWKFRKSSRNRQNVKEEGEKQRYRMKEKTCRGIEEKGKRDF